MSFMASKKLVEIELEYIDMGDDIIVVRDEDTRKLFKKKNVPIKKIKAKFHRPRWSSYNVYIKDVVKEDPTTGKMEYDAILLKRNKFSTLLAELKDDEGNEVPIDRDLFENIHQDIPIGLIDRYDEKINKERENYLRKLNLFEEEENDSEEEKSE